MEILIDPKGFIEKGFVFCIDNQPVMVTGFDELNNVKVKFMNTMEVGIMNYHDVAKIQQDWFDKNPTNWT